MKKEYIKPEMLVYDIQMTRILCESGNGKEEGEPEDYSLDFN